MKFLKSLLFVATATLLMVSCQKEYSLEDAGGVALGTLKSDTFGDCLPSSVNGIYKVDSTLGTGNYIDLQVNLTVGGSYSIVSDTVNGYYFKGTGSAAPGMQTIRLSGIGKPIIDGPDDFIISFGGSECFITVTVVSAATPIAQFTLVGSPGVCTSAFASGSYIKDTVLNFSNTLTLTVNVTALGAYTISASGSGMLFESGGVFTTLGNQVVTLNGSGTPTSSGPVNITVGSSNNNCMFSIVVALGGGTGPATNFIMANINGVATTFNENIVSTISSPTGFPVLLVTGQKATGSSEALAFSIILPPASTFTAANPYTVNQLAAGINVLVAYNDAAANEYSIVSEVTPQNPGFTILLNTINATRISGIFNGTVTDSVGNTKTIDNGSFSVPR